MNKIAKGTACVFLTHFAEQSNQKLIVHGPQELRDLFYESDGLIQSQLSNFGHIPFGQSMGGRLYYNASINEMCDPDIPFTDDWSGDPDDILSPIVLVEQGNCSIVQQVRNIEKNGGALALVIDTVNEDVSNVVMSDDGTGAGIRIPAMLINKNDGEKLKKYLLTAKRDLATQVSLTAEFKVPVNENNTVSVDFWYTSSDDKSMDLLLGMKDLLEPIIDKINFRPRPVSWACPHCDEDYKMNNCISDGKYCAMQHDYNLHLNGVNIIKENIRQVCLDKMQTDSQFIKETEEFTKPLLRKVFRNIFFEYIDRAHTLCRNRISEDCYNEIIKSFEEGSIAGKNRD